MPIYPQQKTARPSNPVLTTAVAGYANDPKNFLQDKLLPTLFNASTAGGDSFWSGTIQRLAEGAMFGDPSTDEIVGRGETYPIDEGAEYDPMEFVADKYGRMVQVPWEDQHMVQSGASPNAMVQLAKIVQTLRLKREARFASLFMTAANWRTAVTLGATQKWDQTTSDPNEDFADAIYGVEGFGVSPNVCILGRKAADDLRKNGAFLEFDSYTIDRTIMSNERLADVIKSRYNIEHVFIGTATHKTATDLQTANLTAVNVWDDDVWIGYLPMSPSGAPLNGPGVGQLNATGDLFPMQSMAAARVVVEDWTVETALNSEAGPGFTADVDLHKVRYSESIFAVLPGLGATIAATST